MNMHELLLKSVDILDGRKNRVESGKRLSCHVNKTGPRTRTQTLCPYHLPLPLLKIVISFHNWGNLHTYTYLEDSVKYCHSLSQIKRRRVKKYGMSCL
jgi:hypothetical protein